MTKKSLNAKVHVDHDGWASIQTIDKIAKKLQLDDARKIALKRTLASAAALKAIIENLENEVGAYSEYRDRFQRVDRLFANLLRELSSARTRDAIENFLSSDIEYSLRQFGMGRDWPNDRAIVQDYLRVTHALHVPIAAIVALNRRRKGGAPQDWKRDLLLEKLAESCEAIIGRKATTTLPSKAPRKGTSFFQLCDSVFTALRLSNSGLDKAIRPKLRQLEPRKLKRVARRP